MRIKWHITFIGVIYLIDKTLTKKVTKMRVNPEIKLAQPRKDEKLTDQEWIFVREYMQVKNCFVAHQLATGKYDPIAAITWVNRPKIKLALDNIAKHFESQVLQSLNEWIHDVEMLAQECREKGELANVIRCKQMTGTALGFLKQINNTQVNVINNNFSPDDALAQLKNRLQIEQNTLTLSETTSVQGNKNG